MKNKEVLNELRDHTLNQVDNNNDDNETPFQLIKDLTYKIINHPGNKMGVFARSLLRANVVIRSYDDGRRSGGGSRISSTSSRSDGEHELVLSFVVTQDLCNSFDTLHGGASATAVDVFTSILLLIKHRGNESVTSDLHISCTSPAPLGSTVVCVCKTLKTGSTLQFASCDIYKEIIDDNDHNDNNNTGYTTVVKRRVLVSTGLHTKYVINKRRRKGYDGSSSSSTTTNGGNNVRNNSQIIRSKL
mmetsp:Transcript_41630/g.45186  ORF Transcript_41630/g.45186 Transcript_41630/m.45186 type:complete len:245 (+) Transcript_41630:65-799(+)